MKTPSKIPFKKRPAKVFFLYCKGDTSIRRVEVVDATPRYVVVRSNLGHHHRERRSSWFHSYHETFAMAKHWAQCEWEKSVKKMEEQLHIAKKAYDEVRNLMEGDLP